MIIGINLLTVEQGFYNEVQQYLDYFFTKLIAANSSQHFIIFSSVSVAVNITSSSNCKIVVVKADKAIFQKIYTSKILLPQLIRENKIAVMWQLGTTIKSNNVKQIVFASENLMSSFLKQKNNILGYVLLAKMTVEQNQANNISASRVVEILPYLPLNINTADIKVQQIIDGYADGRNYFLFINETTTHSNIVAVLKAFSYFKKWQQSNMKLVVIDKWITPNNSSFSAQLETYKYRDDVILLSTFDTDILSKLAYASYSTIYMPTQVETPITILQLLQMQAAIICSNNEMLQQFGANSMLYANALQHEEIGQQMVQLFKNESLRTELIKKTIALNLQYQLQQDWQFEFNKIMQLGN